MRNSKITFFSISLLVLFFLGNYKASAQENDKIEILLVGFAHLGQLDNGSPSSGIFSSEKQNQLKQLRDSLELFKPDMIMVELEPSEQKWNDSLYQLFRNGKLDLENFKYGAGETFQIGYKLGRELDLKNIYGVNYHKSTSQSLLEKGHNIDLFQRQLDKLQKTARPMAAEIQEGNLSLYDFIKKINEPEMLDLTHQLLFNIPAYVQNGNFSEALLGDIDMATVDKNYIGAEYISLFYNRNLKIYSNILNKQMETGNKRILLIIGQAHVGVLKDLLEDNPAYRVHDAISYLN